jgi:hypothetical protein
MAWKGRGSELVFLIKARDGFSRRLWNKCLELRESDEARAMETKGVFLRAMVSPPMGEDHSHFLTSDMLIWDGHIGSAGRVRWDEYSTVIIVVGGSGVSFGTGTLEYVCRRMALRDLLGHLDQNEVKGGCKTVRVRFVWIAREFGEREHVATKMSSSRGGVVRSTFDVDRPGHTKVPQYGPSSAAPGRCPCH